MKRRRDIPDEEIIERWIEAHDSELHLRSGKQKNHKISYQDI